MTRKKPTLKLAQVTKTEVLSQTIKRIYLRTDAVSLHDPKNLGGYIKLMFNPNGSTDLSSVEAPAKPIMRTYTIAKIDRDEIAVDFVMHTPKLPSPETGGYGANWAANVNVGDEIHIAGPGQSALPNFDSDHILLVADLTSLPALTRVIELLDQNATGNVLLVNEDSSFSPQLDVPDGMLVSQFSSYQKLENFMNNDFIWVSERHSIWCACEYSMMRTLRRLCSEHLPVDKDYCYFSSYWKLGMTEDGHKIIKQQDSAEQTS